MALLISLFLHGTALFFLGRHTLPKPEGRTGQSTSIALVNLGKPNIPSLPSESTLVSNKDFFQTSANLEPVPEAARPEVEKDVPTVKPDRKTVKKETPVKEKVPHKPAPEQTKEQSEEKPPAKPEVNRTPSPDTDLPEKVQEKTMSEGSRIEPSGTPSPEKSERKGSLILDAEKAGVNKRVKPFYPRVSRLRKEEGTVILLVKIENGRVISSQVESSSGYSGLDRSAVDAIQKWTFNYKAEAMVRIPVIFRLENR